MEPSRQPPSLPHTISTLRQLWPQYMIRWDFRRQVFVASRGPSVLEAPDCEQLHQQIRRDYVFGGGET